MIVSTRKETQDGINKNQMKTDMKVLIDRINANSDLKLTIIQEETNPPCFEISIEYEPYTEGPPYFQRRISRREAETIAWNIFHNIKDYHGYDYNNPNIQLVKPRDEGMQYSDEEKRDYIEYRPDEVDIPLHKKVHVRMVFSEGEYL